MAIYKIRLELEQDESGAYTVTSPDVPGLLTAGYTPEEIARNVQEVITDLIEIYVMSCPEYCRDNSVNLT